MHKKITVRKIVLSVPVNEVSVHAVLDCSSVMQLMVVVKDSSWAELQRSSNVCMSDILANVHRSDRAARHRTALIRCRNDIEKSLKAVINNYANREFLTSVYVWLGKGKMTDDYKIGWFLVYIRWENKNCTVMQVLLDCVLLFHFDSDIEVVYISTLYKTIPCKFLF